MSRTPDFVNREIYAIYTDDEDLINIGAFSPGSNKRIDGSIALIDRIHNFLTQPIRQQSSFEQTVEQLIEFSNSWDDLLTGITTERAATVGTD